MCSSFQPVNQDEPIIQILCEWAVSTQRWGEHRAMVVAKLLEKRQSDLVSNDNDVGDEKDSVSSAAGAPPGLPVFQPLLMHFLDSEAPVLGKSFLLYVCILPRCIVFVLIIWKPLGKRRR